MKRHQRSNERSNRPIPLHDYGQALRTAVSWLGDRYLLAEPVTKRAEDRAPFYNTPRAWHGTSRPTP